MELEQLWDDDAFEEPGASGREKQGTSTVQAVAPRQHLETTSKASESFAQTLNELGRDTPLLKLNATRFQQLQLQVLKAEANLESALEAVSAAALRVETCKELLEIMAVLPLTSWCHYICC